MPIELHGTYYTATEAAEELGYRDGSYVSRLYQIYDLDKI